LEDKKTKELFIWSKRFWRSIGIIRNIRNWPIVFIDYLGMKNNIEVYYLMRNGTKIKVRGGTADKAIIVETWIDREYFPEGFTILEKDTVIDIGAHIGIFSIMASQMAKKGKVYSFEPVPSNFELLKSNVQGNRIQNILAFNEAVTRETENREIYICDQDTTCHTFDDQRVECLRQQGIEFSKKISVKTTTLDRIVEENNILRIDFLKIDAEGSEFDILLSCSDQLLCSISIICMECHTDILKMKQFLENRGFKVTTDTPVSLLFAYNISKKNPKHV
jgi:FkbM family methyltransferase